MLNKKIDVLVVDKVAVVTFAASIVECCAFNLNHEKILTLNSETESIFIFFNDFL